MNTKYPPDKTKTICPTEWQHYHALRRTGGDIREGDFVRHVNGEVGLVTKVTPNGYYPTLVTYAVGATEYVCIDSMVCVVEYIPPQNKPEG